MAEFVFLSEKNRERYLKIIAPVGGLFAKTGIHPNVLTVTGFFLSILAAFLYSAGAFFWAAWVVVIAGTCDALDGQIARLTRKNTPFGAFFDSTLDRYSDMFLLLGLAYYYSGGRAFLEIPGAAPAGEASPWTVVILILALTGSFMVSYARARAEGLGIQCRSGMMQRPERVTLLIIGSLLGAAPLVGPVMMKCTLWALALSTNMTAIHRILHVRNEMSKENVLR
ncbi:MAG: CDP-alcohol phosphatidyltransferase family protein [Deltaproteobacteria bacterium]|nr:CDP-alcohol phosphatidyltransferase family protein [Deltaproteobacteria bacterium]